MSRSVDNGGSDAEDTKFVYDWRLQQEAALRDSKGAGMTDEQVINFVNGCKCHQARRSQAIAEFRPAWPTIHPDVQPGLDLRWRNFRLARSLADLDLNRLSGLRTLHANAA
jgi:hypothetical protein